MKSILLVFSIFMITITVPFAFAEGGGGVDCPAFSGGYTFVNGSAVYDTISFGEDDFGVLTCEFLSDEQSVQIGSINAIFHIGEELSQQLTEEYGCAEKMGFEMSPLYVASTTHFAVVTFTTSGLLSTAESIISQIEQNNISTICIKDSSNESAPKIDEETKKELEEIIKQMDEPTELKKDLDEFIDEVTDDEEFESSIETVLPDWIKNNAEWWASDQITESDFLTGIEYLITEGVIVLPPTEVDSETGDGIPGWVKFNAGWWASDQITDSEFIDGLQFLISSGIISVT